MKNNNYLVSADSLFIYILGIMGTVGTGFKRIFK